MSVIGSFLKELDQYIAYQKCLFNAMAHPKVSSID